MSRKHHPYKDTQVFDWDAEPHDERPSEFVPTTGYSVLSGYYAAPEPGRRRRGRSGVNPVIVASAVVVALATAALLGFLHLVQT